MRITKIKNPTALNTLLTMSPMSAPLGPSPAAPSASSLLAPEDWAGLLLLPGLWTQLWPSQLVSCLHSHDLTPSSALWHSRLRSLNMQLMASEQTSPWPRAWWHLLLNTWNPDDNIYGTKWCDALNNLSDICTPWAHWGHKTCSNHNLMSSHTSHIMASTEERESSTL